MNQKQDLNEISPWDNIEDLDAITEQQVEEYQPQDLQNIESIPDPDKKKCYKINTANSRLELKLLRKIIYRNGWKEVYQNGDICWLGLPFKYSNLDEYYTQRVNRFPGMDLLSHKTQSTFYLKKFYQYFPEEYDFFPKSYNLPEEAEEFQNNYKSGKTYIAKPDAGSQGDGIYLIKSLKDIKQYDNVVVQEYISKPLLIDNKKFDLRLFVLITSLDPFICYINKEGLARFCTQDYEKPNEKNLRNPFMHLTNYSLNKRSVDFKTIQSDQIYEINEATKRTYTSVKKNLEIQGYNLQEIEQKIDELVVAFLKSLYPFLIYNCKIVFQKRTPEIKCFQVLGFDVLLDEAGKPWLLEVNSNPSVSIDHEVFGKDGKSVFEESYIDDKVKSGVVQDAMFLSMKSKEKQQEECQEYKSYRQLEVEQDVGDTVIGKMLSIYGYLSGYKFQDFLTASKFCKLGSLPNMTNAQFTKYDYDLGFRKILLNSGFNNQMDFFHFILAIELVSKKLNEEVPDLVDRILLNIL